MSSGIRATVTFDEPGICPLASLSEAADTSIDTVTRSVASAGTTGSVTEFRVDAEAVAAVDETPRNADFTQVITLGSIAVYRFEHDEESDCPCARLGRVGCPIDRYAATPGRLELSFHAQDYEQLQAAVADLRDRFPSIDVTRLLRSPGGDDRSDGVFVDRARLTARQIEVLRTAVEKGYFDHPKRANAGEVAAELGITGATFSEHLSIGLRKILGDLFEED